MKDFEYFGNSLEELKTIVDSSLSQIRNGPITSRPSPSVPGTHPAEDVHADPDFSHFTNSFVFSLAMAQVELGSIQLNDALWEESEFDFSISNDLITAKPTISFSLSHALKTPIRNQVHSLSMDLEVFFEENAWEISGKVGWISFDFGFNPHWDIEESGAKDATLFTALKSVIPKIKSIYLETAEEHKKGNLIGDFYFWE